MVDVLREGIAVFGRLERAGMEPLVVWFEDLLADPAGTLRAILPDLPLTDGEIASRAARIMAEDAQAGSGLARDLVEVLPVEEGFVEEFDREWHRAVAESSFRTAALPLVARLG